MPPCTHAACPAFSRTVEWGCRLVEDWPTMLDVASFEAAMQEAQRMMPGKDIEAMIVNNPGIVFSFQRGSDLIPYDPPNNSDG